MTTSTNWLPIDQCHDPNGLLYAVIQIRDAKFSTALQTVNDGLTLGLLQFEGTVRSTRPVVEQWIDDTGRHNSWVVCLGSYDDSLRWWGMGGPSMGEFKEMDRRLRSGLKPWPLEDKAVELVRVEAKVEAEVEDHKEFWLKKIAACAAKSTLHQTVAFRATLLLKELRAQGMDARFSPRIDQRFVEILFPIRKKGTDQTIRFLFIRIESDRCRFGVARSEVHNHDRATWKSLDPKTWISDVVRMLRP